MIRGANAKNATIVWQRICDLHSAGLNLRGTYPKIAASMRQRICDRHRVGLKSLRGTLMMGIG